ncbi:MAG TPA: extracellular solute-binding protein [Tepidisphaeraceae bacterium]|nr:extracellular solute-binding protein [Tepidisphaeraceae bacterium]
MAWIRPIIFTILSAIGGLFLILGSPPRPKQLPPGFVTVEYWEKWTGNEAAQMQQIVDDFNRTVGQEKKIYVHYMSMSDIDQKTLIATSAGVPPDIAGLWDHQITQFAAMGAIQPLDAMASAHGITAKTYLPVFWKACHYNGHLYALVSTPGTVALIYNKQIFHAAAAKLRAAGLDPSRPPRTLAEFDRYAAAFDKRDSSGQIIRAGFLPLQSWYVAEFTFWFGGDIFNPITHQFTLTSTPMLRAYQWIQSYSNRLGRTAMNNFQNSLGNFDSPNNPFLDGELVMQQQGPWMANYIEHLKPSMSAVLVPKKLEHTLPDRRTNYAWGVAPFPSAVPGVDDISYNSFDALVIPTGARHPQAAFDFIAYVNRQDVAEKLCTLHCKNCQLAHVDQAYLNNHPNPYIDVFRKLASSPNAHGAPSVPIWPEVVKTMIDAAQSVALEGNDPAKVLANAQRRLQAEYDRFHHIEIRRRELGIN